MFTLLILIQTLIKSAHVTARNSTIKDDFRQITYSASLFPNEALPGPFLKQLESTSGLRCALACLSGEYGSCGSFNYFTEAGRCQLANYTVKHSKWRDLKIVNGSIFFTSPQMIEGMYLQIGWYERAEYSSESRLADLSKEDLRGISCELETVV